MTSPASPSSSKIGVLLVEDQTAIRQMLASFVAALPGFAVIGEAKDCQQALARIRELRPQVVVLDWMLPDGTGQEVLGAMRDQKPAPEVLVFSANTTELAVRTALSLGARGYIEKTASFDDFTAALRQVASGQVFLGTAVSAVVHRLVRNPQAAACSVELSPRENDILRHVAGLRLANCAGTLAASSVPALSGRESRSGWNSRRTVRFGWRRTGPGCARC
ncbi:MAG TPA: response regulator transcription factor [Opitutaceae bacterium]